jgi:hypothetical protein
MSSAKTISTKQRIDGARGPLAPELGRRPMIGQVVIALRARASPMAAVPDEDDHLPEQLLRIDQLSSRKPHRVCREPQVE